MFTEERISEILAVCEKATPEWKAGNFKRCIVTDAIDGSVFGDDSNREYYGGSLVAESIHPANRDFAILARTVLPQLAEEVIKLRAVAESAQSLLVHCVHCGDFRNGNVAYGIDEGEVGAERIIRNLEKALATAGYGGEE